MVPLEANTEGVTGGKRRQLPIVLTWKSQGMSLELVLIQFRDRLIEHGLVYCAVSRARKYMKLFFRKALPAYADLMQVCARPKPLQLLAAQARLHM